MQFLLFLYPARVCRKVFEREMAQYPYETSEYVAPISGLYGLKDVLPQKWFERAPVYLPFCDMKVPVIAEFNEYLRHMYGDDYMTPHQFSRYK